MLQSYNEDNRHDPAHPSQSSNELTDCSQFVASSLLKGSMLGFPKIRGTFFGDPYKKDFDVLGSILGSPYFGKVPCNCTVDTWALKWLYGNLFGH